MADNVDIKDAGGATVPVATKDIGGVEFQKVILAAPADGSDIKPASQSDVQAVGTAVGTLLKPSDIAALATSDDVAEVRDRLPATAHAQPLTDAQLRASALALSDGASTAAGQANSDEVVHLVLRALGNLISRIPMPTAALELRCRMESANNAAMNMSQWGGQTAASGQGASGNGAPRVTPSNDTVAGTPHLYAFHTSLDVRNFRNRVTT